MSEDRAPRAIVQEADCSEQVAVLKIRVPGRSAFIVVAATRDGTRAAGLLDAATRKAIWGARLPPGSGRLKGREASLLHAAVSGIGPHAVAIEIPGARLRREVGHEVGRQATADTNPVGAPVAEEQSTRWLVAKGGRVAWNDTEPRDGALVPFLVALERDRETLEARGAEIARAVAKDAIASYRDEALRALEKASQRVERRRRAIAEDLAKIAKAEAIAAQAQWLVAEAKRTPRGATQLVVTDWSTGEAVPMIVPLDPARSAQEQVEAMFKRAKRLKLGGRIAEDRLAQSDGAASALETATLTIRDATALADIEATLREAKRAAPRDLALPGGSIEGGGRAHDDAGAKRRGGASPRVPFRTFIGKSGAKLFVGKGAADNDALTLKIARPHDLWLHAKGRTGAHVIVPLDKGRTCPADDLVDAAHLAAHFSEARDEAMIDVQYTHRRHLRKPKGSAPGFVVVDREKVLALRLEPARLRELLEREET